MTKTILLADDHPIFRDGLRRAIEANPSFKVVSEVGDGEAALAQIELLQPDFALFDLSMPRMDGFSALERLQGSDGRTRILIVSMHNEIGYAQRAKELGAIGFVAKEDAASEIIRILSNDSETFFMRQSIGRTDLTSRLLSFSSKKTKKDLEPLTRAERSVLKLLSRGWTSKQIARELDVSPRTIQAHRRNISEKLNVTGPNQLLHLAVSMGDYLAKN